MLLEGLSCPFAKQYAARGFDAVADCNNDIKIIKIYLPRDLSTTFLFNLCKFCTG